MPQKYEFELNITLADGGRGARDVIEIYGNQVCGDLEQTAWNLCNCDDAVQSEKFANLTLVQWTVTKKRGDNFRIKAQFTVNALDEAFINQVVEQYMDGFTDYLADAQNGYYSRTGRRATLDATPLEWEVTIQ